MKVLLNSLLPISLDRKKGGKRAALSEKASSKAVFLILLLHNSFKDVLLLLPLYPLIISSSLRLFADKLGISVFNKDNARKSRGNNLESTIADVDGKTNANCHNAKRESSVIGKRVLSS